MARKYKAYRSRSGGISYSTPSGWMNKRTFASYVRGENYERGRAAKASAEQTRRHHDYLRSKGIKPRHWIRGPKGGYYYISENGNKVYR